MRRDGSGPSTATSGPGSTWRSPDRSAAWAPTPVTRSRRDPVGSGDREPQDPHERFRPLGRPPASVALPSIFRYGVSDTAPLPDTPVEDHPPAARGLLAALEKLCQIGQGATDDDEITRRRAQVGAAPPSRHLADPRAFSRGAGCHAIAEARRLGPDVSASSIRECQTGRRLTKRYRCGRPWKNASVRAHPGVVAALRTSGVTR